MPLKAVLDSLDSVAEGLREHYTQAADGKFYLDAEEVDHLPSVRGLKTKRDELLAAQARTKEELKKYEGIDPEEYQRLKDAADEAERVKLEASGKAEDVKKALEQGFQREKAKLEAEIAKRDAEVAKRDRFIERLLVDQQLDSAMADKDVNVLPQYRAAVKALLQQRGPKVVNDDDDYRALFSTDLGDVAIVEYVKTWARSDEAAPFLPASGTSGSGAQGSGGTGGGGRNPWKKETFNLTEQGRIAREDPGLATRLKAAAGVA
jgi:DNA-directed RNA polymerase subunit F